MVDKVRARTDELSWREVDDCIVVLDLRASTFLELNASASVLWRRLVDGSASTDDLAQLLVSAFGIDAERAALDAEHFVNMLEASGLLDP